ncbi:OsmC family protein [Vibrio cholerae]
MAKHIATVEWQRAPDEPFSDNQYHRSHQWHFDGGAVIDASSSPHVVPLPYSTEANVDPEEAFIAAISSCHMLTFLGIAAKQRFVVDHYRDEAVGKLEENSQGYSSVTQVILSPRVIFSGEKRPTRQQLEKLHHLAHQHCFIANSVTTEIITHIDTAE